MWRAVLRKWTVDRTVSHFSETKKLPDDYQPPQPQRSGLHIVLTGSTGSLGTQILVKLASDARVARISCLDRSPNAHDRVAKSLSSWPKPPVLELRRIAFHQADSSKPDFGLTQDVLTDLGNTVNVIIHNAWMVNFNHSPASYEAVHIRRVLHLIHFSAASKLCPRIVFASSISSIANWPSSADGNQPFTIPERMAPSPAVAQPMGYAESKAVAEQLLAAATQRAGIRASIVRIGQIAGPVAADNGATWNQHEWFPLLLQTSKTRRKIPDASSLLIGKIDWLPVHLVAASTIDIATGWSDERALQVYHLVNPATVPWAQVLPAVQHRLGGIEAVSLHEWVHDLSSTAANGDDDAALPAKKILDFFKGMLERGEYMESNDIKVATEEVQRASPGLAKLGPVQGVWIERWIKDLGI
ncbi:hypothetical protein ACEQ8H_002037 [Pleosporales sp. CAS-2024a]